MVGSSGRENNIAFLDEKLALLYPRSVKRGKYHRIFDQIKDITKNYHYVPNFDRYMRERIDEVLSGERDINSKKFDALATAAVVYELHRRDPTYFDFVKPGNVADVAVETFDYLLNQGKAREVYRRLEEFLEKPLSQVPEFQKLVEFIDKYGFTPYKEEISREESLIRRDLNGNGDVINDGFAAYVDFEDKYEFNKLRDNVERNLLPAFAKVIAKKTEEYLKKLGY